jgi:2-keto-4-pentenoate hydratase/2-oxohepta-3-ene-1,7-dioic acid hydratase in catechol pathway
MKLALYRKHGRTCFGAVTAQGLVTLNGKCGPGVDALADLLARGDFTAAAQAAEAAPDVTLADAVFLPLIVPNAKILCAGKNYQAHAEETGQARPKPDVGFFVKVPSALVAHGAPLRLPRVSAKFDFEGELCVVVGRAGRHIAEADALAHVAGYTCLMDGSVRDYQNNSVAAGKNFEASGSVGPWMVTADEVPDPSRLVLTTRLNGEIVQHSGVDALIHSIPKMIAYMSGITTLRPGDLIATGTPEGVGWHRTPPRWLAAGDTIEIEIPGVATLSNTVLAEGQAG